MDYRCQCAIMLTRPKCGNSMPSGLLPVLILIAMIIIYVVAKVVFYVRQSEAQWRQVDKSKLREWDDEDD